MGKDAGHRQLVKRVKSFQKKKRRVGKEHVRENLTQVNFGTRTINVPMPAVQEAAALLNHRKLGLQVGRPCC